jgi:hypothetical protein
LGMFPHLTVLALQGNGMSGTLPSEWSNMTSLQELTMSNNAFSVSCRLCICMLFWLHVLHTRPRNGFPQQLASAERCC